MSTLELNYDYDLSDPPTHLISADPVEYNAEGTGYSIEIISQETVVPLKSAPKLGSETLVVIMDKEPVTILREWATGSPKWAYVAYHEPGASEATMGYVLTKHIVPIELGMILPKKEINLQSMTRVGRTLVPTNTWMANEAPYYHTENGEWWFTVTLNYECVEEGTLESKKEEAKKIAAASMYAYFDINYQEMPVFGAENPDIFASKIQSAYVKDFFLSARPGSKLMMLVTIPAIYIEYLRHISPQSQIDESEIDKDYCISIPASSEKDLEDAKQMIIDCLVEKFQSYLNSDVHVTNFNFENEIYKQTEGIERIKFLLNQNNIDIESVENQTASPDFCETSPVHKKVQVCFSNDGNYSLKAVYYYNGSGKKILLSSGLNLVKNTFPFNEARFGHLFLNYQAICSLPELSLKDFFDTYVVDPKPEYTWDVDTISTNNAETKKKLTPYASAELGVYVNTALFLTSLAKQFGNIYDLNQAGAGNIGYNCYSSNKAVEAFKLKSLEFRDSQYFWASDIMSFFQWICQLDFDSFDDAVRKGGRGGSSSDSRWGFLGVPEAWTGFFSIKFSEWRMPSFSLIEAIRGISLKAMNEAADQIRVQLIRFLVAIACELALAAIAAGVAIGTGAAIASYYNSQGRKNKLGLSTPSFGSPAELATKDYGGENCNNIMQDSLGTTGGEYDEYLLQIFLNCGVYIPGNQKSMPREYLDGVSSIVSPVEMLTLLNGSASNFLINTVFKYTQQNFPDIMESKNTSSKIAGLFVCLGENTTQDAVDKVQQKIEEKINDVELCENLAEKLKGIIQEKCPSPEVYESVYEKEFGSKIETYQEIIKLLDDECNNININLFNNPETGESGILNSLSGQIQGQDTAVGNIVNTIVEPIKTFNNIEFSDYFIKYGYSSAASDIVFNFNKASLIDYTSGQTALTKGGNTYTYEIFADSSTVVALKLQEDGSELMTATNIGDGGAAVTSQEVVSNPQELGESVQQILDNTLPQDKIGLTRHQQVFYSLVDSYFKNNSKDSYGNEISPSPIPYGITYHIKGSPPGGQQDFAFKLIYASFLQKYAKKVSSAWTFISEEQLKAYSDALSSGIDQIVNYDKFSQEVKRHWAGAADYDDPNDSDSIGPKQFSLMNGAIIGFVSLQIAEYLAMTMPLYEPFDLSGTPELESPMQILPELTKDVIKDRIYEDLKEKLAPTPAVIYNTFINDTYDFVKNRGLYDVEKEYTGNERGLDFYIDTNFQDVYDSFKEAMQSVPEEYKISKSWVENDTFMYNKKIGLEVHNYAGLQDFHNTIYGESIPPTGQADYPFSLFNPNDPNGSVPRYELFRNGMFFIQNYFYIEDKPIGDNYPQGFQASAWENRSGMLRGALNLYHIEKITQNWGFETFQLSQKPMSDFFDNIKMGARLCYGVAVDPEGVTDEDIVQELANEIASSFQKDATFQFESTSNNEHLTTFLNGNNQHLESEKALASMHKYLVCVDGPSPSFTAEGLNSPAVSPPFTFSGAPAGHQNYTLLTESQYSIVIPLFSVEDNLTIGMNENWQVFTNNIKYWCEQGGETPNPGEIFIYPEPQITNFPGFENLNSQLINSDEYKALTKACFSLQNMIHFNAFSGYENIVSKNEELKNVLEQTKQLFVNNMQNILNAKSAMK